MLLRLEISCTAKFPENMSPICECAKPNVKAKRGPRASWGREEARRNSQAFSAPPRPFSLCLLARSLPYSRSLSLSLSLLFSLLEGKNSPSFPMACLLVHVSRDDCNHFDTQDTEDNRNFVTALPRPDEALQRHWHSWRFFSSFGNVGLGFQQHQADIQCLRPAVACSDTKG